MPLVEQTSMPLSKGQVDIRAALPTGTNLIGKVGIDQVTANANEVVLKAGAAIAGKVGIDQTTPGTTNGVVEASAATILAKFVPLAKASQHAVAETLNVDILAADLSPTNTPCLFRTMVVLGTAGVFSAQLKSGAVTVVAKLNGGVALTADCAYIFDILVGTGDTVNFQTSVSGNVTLRVQEVVGASQ